MLPGKIETNWHRIGRSKTKMALLYYLTFFHSNIDEIINDFGEMLSYSKRFSLKIKTSNSTQQHNPTNNKYYNTGKKICSKKNLQSEIQDLLKLNLIKQFNKTGIKKNPFSKKNSINHNIFYLTTTKEDWINTIGKNQHFSKQFKLGYNVLIYPNQINKTLSTISKIIKNEKFINLGYTKINHKNENIGSIKQKIFNDMEKIIFSKQFNYLDLLKLLKKRLSGIAIHIEIEKQQNEEMISNTNFNNLKKIISQLNETISTFEEIQDKQRIIFNKKQH
jgi:hypothetical protein